MNTFVRRIVRRPEWGKLAERTFGLVKRTDMLRLGTRYGGWWIPGTEIDDRSICYCVGVGTDISFDLALIERFGCTVWAFDPTPGSIRWVGDQLTPENFVFQPYGIWIEDKTMRFYAPANPSHISHSIGNVQETQRHFDGECRTVATVMKSLGHEHLDLLKLDIEGAEGPVLHQLLGTELRPKVICVEFDVPEPIYRTRKRVAEVTARGYDLVCIEGWNYTFVRR